MSPQPLSGKANVVAWVAQLVAGGILAMAGVMKLISHPESVALFETLGPEPWGRYLLGLVEVVTAGLLLLPSYARLGAFLAIAIMIGAIGSHLTVLGISYGGDATLFGMALVVLAAAIVVARLRRA